MARTHVSQLIGGPGEEYPLLNLKEFVNDLWGHDPPSDPAFTVLPREGAGGNELLRALNR